ncbi:hypothetical protein [Burkholderia sp. NLJ2]|uniref:hypothetical protein n=1 Tax=Burkholderia sp. NLJ2 TaxID=3090699 RepID=UPI003C6BE2A1
MMLLNAVRKSRWVPRDGGDDRTGACREFILSNDQNQTHVANLKTFNEGRADLVTVLFLQQSGFPRSSGRGVVYRNGLPITDLIRIWFDVSACPARCVGHKITHCVDGCRTRARIGVIQSRAPHVNEGKDSFSPENW